MHLQLLHPRVEAPLKTFRHAFWQASERDYGYHEVPLQVAWQWAAALRPFALEVLVGAGERQPVCGVPVFGYVHGGK